jgi:hypothetical protein
MAQLLHDMRTATAEADKANRCSMKLAFTF